MMTPENVERLKKIKMLVLDVDGILTDSRFFYLETQGWTRFWSVKDGYGLKILMEAGLQVGVISGGESVDVKKRFEFLKVPHVYLGDEKKIIAFDKIQVATGFNDSEMAFMGDELFDIPVLKRAGFSATVPNAPKEVKGLVHHVTTEPGGKGAVREVVDAILYAQNKFPKY